MNARTTSLSSDSLPDATTVDRAAQTAHEAIDRMASKAGPAIDRMRTAASDAAEAFQVKAKALGELEEQWLDSAREQVRERPLTAVAVGVLAGLLLSRLIK